MKKAMLSGIGLFAVALLIMAGTMMSGSSVKAQDDTHAAHAVVSLKITSETDISNAGTEEGAAGDQHVYVGELLDAEGNVVGEEHGSCTAIDEDANLCTAVDTFEDGTIVTIGMSNEGEAGLESDFAISGGTGAYVGEVGAVAQTSTDDEAVFDYVFEIEE